MKPINPRIYFGYFMIGLLILMSAICFFAPAATAEWLPGNRRFIMGAVILIYTILRYFRLKKTIAYYNSHSNEQNDQ